MTDAHRDIDAEPGIEAVKSVRTRLLVSVRNEAEAVEALRGGADWLDFKEPDRGPLGAVDPQTARCAAELLAGKAPLSAAAGELLDWPASSAQALLGVAGIQLLKIGLAGCRDVDWIPRWQACCGQVRAAGKQLVAVAYVDSDAAIAPPIGDVLAVAMTNRCGWLLLDTYDKSAGRLGDYFLGAIRDNLLRCAKGAAVRIAVAGRLALPDISALPLHQIDLIAVRGAACRGRRTSAICADRVAELAQFLANR